MCRFVYSILYSTLICIFWSLVSSCCFPHVSWCLFIFADGFKAVSAQALTFGQHTAFIWVVLWPDKWLLWWCCCWGADSLRDRWIEERRGAERGMHMKHTISLFHPHPLTHSLSSVHRERENFPSCQERKRKIGKVWRERKERGIQRVKDIVCLSLVME